MGGTGLHESQTDMKKGFGGKFGVETDKQDQVQCLYISNAVRCPVVTYF